MNAPSAEIKFSDLGLPEVLLTALQAVGYESPSPIQAATIPPLLEGRDVLGQAQTGTGKTAAFALPVLARIDVHHHVPQALVLTPTRELAIQVAEAFQKYAGHIRGFSVLPVYGGQAYGPQLQSLKRGVTVIVGTPGRIIDHLDRGSLKLDKLKTMVLDEADEMLRMGFIDDVEKILTKTPGEKQVALFSATMPPAIKRIANTYLKNPAEITIAAKTRTATTVKQRVWMVSGLNKLDALTRILEVESFEAMLIFARTKVATEELASKLNARGFAAAALNGDVAQQQRERIVNQLKGGSLDIVVATDVAARGLDVERITHVLNYDVPSDPESYVHRIGRTGRAGRSGEAILFIAPRERGLLRMIENATRQPISQYILPTAEAVDELRRSKFKQKLLDSVLQVGADLGDYRELIQSLQQEHALNLLDLAAALAKLLQGEDLPGKSAPAVKAAYTPAPAAFKSETPRREYATPAAEPAAPREPRHPFAEKAAQRMERPERPKRDRGDDADKETYRVMVGHDHGVKPGNIVGAIANEAGIDSQHIGRIEINEDHSLIDLPAAMPKDVLRKLQGVWVVGHQLRIHPINETAPPAGKPSKHLSKPPVAAAEDDADDEPAFEAPRSAPSGKRDFRKPNTATIGFKPGFSGKPSYGKPSSPYATGKSEPREKRSYGDKPAYAGKSERSYGDKPSYTGKPAYAGKSSYAGKSDSRDKPSYGDKPGYAKKSGYAGKSSFGGKASFGPKPGAGGDKPANTGPKKYPKARRDF